jgi:hypothetical protein
MTEGEWEGAGGGGTERERERERMNGRVLKLASLPLVMVIKSTAHACYASVLPLNYKPNPTKLTF